MVVQILSSKVGYNLVISDVFIRTQMFRMFAFLYFTDKLNLLGAGEFSYLNKMELDLMDGINYHTKFQSVIVSSSMFLFSSQLGAFKRKSILKTIVFFKKIQDSLYAFGVSSQDQEHIFTMLAAILWLGNITLPTLGNESQGTVSKFWNDVFRSVLYH